MKLNGGSKREKQSSLLHCHPSASFASHPDPYPNSNCSYEGGEYDVISLN